MADNLIIVSNNQYSNLIDSIGEILQKSKQQIATSVNTILVDTYWQIGKYIVEFEQQGSNRAEYGDNLIKEYSKRLTLELGKKFNLTLLKNIRQFYLVVQKGPTMSDQLTWSHYVELLKFDDINEINYYIDISIKQKFFLFQKSLFLVRKILKMYWQV